LNQDWTVYSQISLFVSVTWKSYDSNVKIWTYMRLEFTDNDDEYCIHAEATLFRDPP